LPQNGSGGTDRWPTSFHAAWRRRGPPFARTGRPDNPAIPRWPAYTLSERATLGLDRDCQIENDYGREAAAVVEADRSGLMKPIALPEGLLRYVGPRAASLGARAETFARPRCAFLDAELNSSAT